MVPGVATRTPEPDLRTRPRVHAQRNHGKALGQFALVRTAVALGAPNMLGEPLAVRPVDQLRYLASRSFLGVALQRVVAFVRVRGAPVALMGSLPTRPSKNSVISKAGLNGPTSSCLSLQKTYSEASNPCSEKVSLKANGGIPSSMPRTKGVSS